MQDGQGARSIGGRNGRMGNKSFKIRNAEKEIQYERVGGICYWGRHYIYKDYTERCVYDKDKTDEIKSRN